MKLRGVRAMTGVIVLWCAIVISIAILTVDAADCRAGLSARAGCMVGVGATVLFELLVGFFGFVFLAIIWFMTRTRTRQCPRCGESIEVGVMHCHRCRWDFTLMTP